MLLTQLAAGLRDALAKRLANLAGDVVRPTGKADDTGEAPSKNYPFGSSSMSWPADQIFTPGLALRMATRARLQRNSPAPW